MVKRALFLRRRGRPSSVMRAAWLVALLAPSQACASHSERMLPVRAALDAAEPQQAISLLNTEMDVTGQFDLPRDVGGNSALLLLDRASIEQSLAQFDRSRRDFEVADKAIDMLDLAHDAGD